MDFDIAHFMGRGIIDVPTKETSLPIFACPDCRKSKLTVEEILYAMVQYRIWG